MMGKLVTCPNPSCGKSWDSWWAQFDGAHCPFCQTTLPEDLQEKTKEDLDDGFRGMTRGPIRDYDH